MEGQDPARFEMDGLFPSGWLDGGMAVLDLEGIVREWNEPLREWLGIQPGSPGGTPQSLWDLLAARFPEAAESLAAFRRRSEPFGVLFLNQSTIESGAQLWFKLEGTRHENRVFVRLSSFLPPQSELAEAPWDEHLRTRSARREMFVRLLRAEAQIEKLERYWPGVIFSQRPDLSFQFVSPKIEVLTGVSPAEWRQQPQRFWQVVHEADSGEMRQQLRRSAKSREPVTNTFRLRHSKTGQISYVLEHRHPIVSSGGLLIAYEGVWLDVTRQTIAEKRLSSAAWKETLAVLTMGLAHDFSNIMAGIHSLSECYLSQVDTEHPFHEGLGLIKKNSLQASQLVHRIINLHLGKTGDRNYHDLNQLVTELSDLVRKITPKRIKVAAELQAGTMPVYVDAFEFQQVVVNLARNAADAMSKTGELALRTSIHTQWPSPLNLQGMVPRLPCVCTEVHDTGVGIKAAHLGSIFDPFFTTKPITKGSGLGLYNARLFAEKHHGAISVESEEGRGSVFRIWLPQAEFSEAERAQGGDHSEQAPRRSLIVMGDHGSMVDDMAEMLRTENYHVVCAHAPEGVEELLSAGDYTYSGLVVFLEAGGLSLAASLAGWRRSHALLKVILRPVGCDHDDLDSDFISQADLILTPEMPQLTLIEKLKSTLEN